MRKRLTILFTPLLLLWVALPATAQREECPPSDPIVLTAAPAGEAAALVWTPGGDVIRYEILGAGGDIFPETLDTSFIDYPVASGVARTYRVRAIRFFPCEPLISNLATTTPLPNRATRSAGDFDGDGTTDLSLFRPSNTTWHWQPSGGGAAVQVPFGQSGDFAVPGDYDGDGTTDSAVFRPQSGEWWVLRSSNFQHFSFPWGLPGDLPVPADYDGDGKHDAAVLRPNTFTWHILRSSDGGHTQLQWGQEHDVPVPGDYDGDGLDDIAIFRPIDGEWWIQGSSAGQMVLSFGQPGDLPVPADWDQDGALEVAVYRPQTGQWFPGTAAAVPFGLATDQPAPGDYTGDGVIDFTVLRNGEWWILNGANFSHSVSFFGAAGDRAVPRLILEPAP